MSLRIGLGAVRKTFAPVGNRVPALRLMVLKRYKAAKNESGIFEFVVKLPTFV
jgi:hypothetical protein